MGRRKFSVLVSAVAVVVAGTLASVALLASRGVACPRRLPPPPEAPSRSTSRPNIVLILTDDQRWDSLWAMPNVRRLIAAHGVTFSNAFVTTSFCCPSRASILTGQYSHHTGVLSDSPPDGGAPAFHDRSTLATWLHDAGYTTALIGKYMNAYAALKPGYVPPGWDEWDAIAQTPIVKFYDYTLNENGRVIEFGGRGAHGCNYSTNVLAGLATRFIRTAGTPFFLYYAPIAPHLPADPAPRDIGRFTGAVPPRSPSLNEADVSDKPWTNVPPMSAAFLREVAADREHMLESLRAVDRSVSAIVQAVADRGQLGNTMFIFSSDNGYLLGEHRILGKLWPYEESIRVPLVIRSPDVAGPGRTEPRLALNIDLASTIAEEAGVSPGLPQDGRSLVPLLRDQTPLPAWRTGFVEEYLGREHPAGTPPDFQAVRTERYLFVEYANGWRELYDLQRDPYELTNIASLPSSAGLRVRLAARLRTLLGA